MPVGVRRLRSWVRPCLSQDRKGFQCPQFRGSSFGSAAGGIFASEGVVSVPSVGTAAVSFGGSVSFGRAMWAVSVRILQTETDHILIRNSSGKCSETPESKLTSKTLKLTTSSKLCPKPQENRSNTIPCPSACMLSRCRGWSSIPYPGFHSGFCKTKAYQQHIPGTLSCRFPKPGALESGPKGTTTC